MQVKSDEIKFEVKKEIVEEHTFKFRVRMQGFKLNVHYLHVGNPNPNTKDGFFGTQSYDEKKGIVRFWNSIVVDGKKVSGISIDNDEIKQALIDFKERKTEEEKQRIAELAKIKVKTFRWAKGGDTHKYYVSTDEIDNIKVQPTQLVEIEKALDYAKIKELRTQSKQIDGPTGLYTLDGWWELSVDAPVIKDALKARQAVLDENKRKKEEREAKRKAIFEKAAKTGEKQQLSSYMDECDDEDESCDWDQVIEYAMPDGSTKTERHHTW